MTLIRDPHKPLESDTALTIGVFDGLHLGHRKILSALTAEAARRGLTPAVVTFDPHPASVLKGISVPLIMPLEHRVALLREAGIETVVCLSFTKEFSKIPAESFVSDILAGKLRARSILTGPDFRFGQGRAGDMALLEDLGGRLGFTITTVEPETVGGRVVSSTCVRELIKEGRVREVGRLLLRPYYISGVVKEGEKRGRQIGFPTANLDTRWELFPRLGVYVTRAEVGGQTHQSITNVGVRPTFGNNDLLIETHLFDFSGDIYGEDIKVTFVDRLRDEQRFESVDALTEQIARDVESARVMLDGEG